MIFISGLSSVIADANVTCVFDTSFTPPSCKTLTITPVTSHLETIYVNGEPTTYVDIAKVNLIINANAAVNYIPTNIFNYFPKIKVMSIDSSQVTTMVTDAFIKCSSLLSLSVTFNNFPLLPDGFAQKCTKVTDLWLQFNHIQTVDANALRGLAQLTSFKLNNNAISCLPDGLFAFSPNLVTVDFSNNFIVNLNSQMFASLTELSYIGFSFNRLCYIPDLALTGSGDPSETFTASFDQNPIYAIHPAFPTNFNLARAGGYMMFQPNAVVALTSLCLWTAQYQGTDPSNWPQANSSFAPCFENWTPAMDSAPVTCDVAVTTALCTPPTTTTSTTTSKY